MNIYNIIITAILLVIIVCGVLIGIKRGMRRTLLSLASNVIAALAAFGLARLFAAGLGESISRTVSGWIAALAPSNSEGLLSLPEITVWSLTAARVIVSVAAFSVFYLIIFLLFKIPIHIINKKLFADKEEPKAGRIVSPIVRVISGILTFILLLSPATSLCAELDNDNIDSYQYVSIEPVKYIQTVSHYPVVKAASAAGGHAFFDALTAFDRNGAHITPSDEVGYIAKFAFNSYDIFSFKNTDADETESSLVMITGALDDSSLLAPSIGTAVPYMASQWLEDKSCMGIKVDIPKGRLGTIVRKILEIISGWTADDVRRDFRMLVDLVDLLNNKNFDINSSPRDILKMFADKEYTTELFVKLNNSEDLRKAIPELVYSSVGMVLDEIGVKMPEGYDTDEVLSSLTDEHAAGEAAIFSDIAATISDIYDANGNVNIPDMNTSQQKELIEAVENLKDSYILDKDTSDKVISSLEDALSKLHNKLS